MSHNGCVLTCGNDTSSQCATVPELPIGPGIMSLTLEIKKPSQPAMISLPAGHLTATGLKGSFLCIVFKMQGPSCL
jgi:hypothetical protein